MKTRESQLWNWLRDGTRAQRPDLDMQRIENLVGVGTPDVEACYQGIAFWIELKAINDQENLDVEVSPEQVMWHRRRARAGGRSWFLIQVGSGAQARRFLIPGHRADALHPGQKPWKILDLEQRAINRGDENPRKLLDLLGI